MLATFVDKNNNNKRKKKEKMSSLSTTNHNSEITTLDTIEREKLKYISKFRFPISVAQHMDLRLILHNVQINDLSIALDIELNSWVLNYLESYQLCPTLVI